MSPEVERLLTESGVAYRIHSHEPLVSFEAARAVLPFDELAMIKGLVFRTPSGYVIVAMRGGDRADYKKIADALSIRRADLRLAPSQDVAADLDMTGGRCRPAPNSRRAGSVRSERDRAISDLLRHRPERRDARDWLRRSSPSRRASDPRSDQILTRMLRFRG